jgi:hypothetical protein
VIKFISTCLFGLGWAALVMFVLGIDISGDYRDFAGVWFCFTSLGTSAYGFMAKEMRETNYIGTASLLNLIGALIGLTLSRGQLLRVDRLHSCAHYTPNAFSPTCNVDLSEYYNMTKILYFNGTDIAPQNHTMHFNHTSNTYSNISIHIPIYPPTPNTTYFLNDITCYGDSNYYLSSYSCQLSQLIKHNDKSTKQCECTSKSDIFTSCGLYIGYKDCEVILDILPRYLNMTVYMSALALVCSILLNFTLFLMDRYFPKGSTNISLQYYFYGRSASVAPQVASVSYITLPGESSEIAILAEVTQIGGNEEDENDPAEEEIREVDGVVAFDRRNESGEGDLENNNSIPFSSSTTTTTTTTYNTTGNNTENTPKTHKNVAKIRIPVVSAVAVDIGNQAHFANFIECGGLLALEPDLDNDDEIESV